MKGPQTPRVYSRPPGMFLTLWQKSLSAANDCAVLYVQIYRLQGGLYDEVSAQLASHLSWLSVPHHTWLVFLQNQSSIELYHLKGQSCLELNSLVVIVLFVTESFYVYHKKLMNIWGRLNFYSFLFKIVFNFQYFSLQSISSMNIQSPTSRGE